MRLTDGERGRLDRSRRRPADGPAALAPTHQMVNGICCTSLRVHTLPSAKNPEGYVRLLSAELALEFKNHVFEIAFRGEETAAPKPKAMDGTAPSA